MTATRMEQALEERLVFLRCPACRGELKNGGRVLACAGCGAAYAVVRDNGDLWVRLCRTVAGTKEEIRTFWGDLYKQWHQESDAALSAESLLALLRSLEEMFRKRRHLAVTEMGLSALAGKRVCEIGSGAGAHSALFRKYGAHVTSVDMTAERVSATARKLDLLKGLSPGSGLAMQADAESLPFADGSFDIVYSNGVLHHTEDTELSLREAHRVLRPGGQAVLMLYARHSALYWLKLFPQGLLSGALFREPEARWLGRVTEGRPRFAGQPNPVTRVYSERALRRLLRDFRQVELRKNGYSFGHAPVPWSEGLRQRLLSALGAKSYEGAVLVYGRPYVPETAPELFLGRWLGFDWNIRALK